MWSYIGVHIYKIIFLVLTEADYDDAHWCFDFFSFFSFFVSE